MDGDIGVFSNSGPTPGIPLEFQGETGLLLSWDGNVGIPLQMKHGNESSSRDEDGKTGLFLSIFFLIFFIFKLYKIVLVLPNIKMNPPQVYMCSPS